MNLERGVLSAPFATPLGTFHDLVATPLIQHSHQFIPGPVVIRLGDAGDLGVTVHRPPRAPVESIWLHHEEDLTLGNAFCS